MPGHRIAFLLLLAGCGGDEPAAPLQNGGPAPTPAAGPYGASPWHADFPQFGGPLHLSPQVSGQWYGRTRRQALAQVVQNLSGTCTREAWVFSKQYFRRVDDEVVDLMIRALDRAGATSAGGDHVQNLADAMGLAGDPRFASSLLRALEHERPGIRAAAMRALVTAGDAASVRRAYAQLGRMELRPQVEWVEAAFRHLGSERIAAVQELLADPRFHPLLRPVVEQTLKLPAAAQPELLELLWPRTDGDLKLGIAVAFHRAGDARGTQLLKSALESRDPKLKALAIEGLAGSDLDLLSDLVLASSIDPSPLVRQASVAAIRGIPGANADNVLLDLADDPVDEVRIAAIGALRDRGIRGPIEQTLDELRTGTGNALVRAIEDVVALREPAAVPLLDARLAAAPLEDQRRYLSALGRIGHPSALAALRRVLLAEERPLVEGRDLTTASYAAMQLANLHGAEAEVLALLDKLPPGDHRRRAFVLTALGNIAATETTSPAIRAAVYAKYRERLHDGAELPQIRLLCLEWLRRDLTVDDAMALKEHLPQAAEPMRRLFNDFLFEFF